MQHAKSQEEAEEVVAGFNRLTDGKSEAGMGHTYQVGAHTSQRVLCHRALGHKCDAVPVLCEA